MNDPSRYAFVQAVSELDSRTDANIRDYFVLTDAIREVRDSRSAAFGVIGLKGCGKTTLYRSLVEEWQQPKSSVRTIGLTDHSAAFSAYFDQINCLQFEQSVKSGMVLFLIQSIVAQPERFAGAPTFDNWLRDANDLLKDDSEIGRCLSALPGLAILGLGLATRASGLDGAVRPSKDSLTQAGELLAKFEQTGLSIKIIVDDPDRLFTQGANFDPHLLAGYILGTNHIAKAYPFISFIHVLKTSVYDSLWEVEELANLPHDYFRYIGWKREELRGVIEARLSFSGTRPSAVFEDTKDFSIDNLFTRIRNGPRDLLRYLEIILKHDSKISPLTIKAHAHTFKVEARRQMESVYSHVYEGIDLFAQSIFETNQYLTVGQFSERFERLRLASKPRGLDYGHAWVKRSERALQACLDAGLIDFRAEDGTWVTPFQPDYFRFNSRDGATLVRRNAVFVPD